MAALDLKAERDKIQREIDALERSLGPEAAKLDVDVSDSDDSDDDLEEPVDGECQLDDVIWEDGGSKAEICLQMNLVYQAVIEEKLQELEVLITQNKEQQEEIMWELAGRKTQRSGVAKLYPLNLAIGHFLKPYFKDKVTGVGPPGNPEMRERNLHIVKPFQELSSRAWKSSDSVELKNAVYSDTLQRMLQPKMLKVEYLQQKLDNAKSQIDKKILTKQIQEAEHEIDDINQLQEDVLLGQRTDAHDWEKISNINFEGIHTAERLCRIWQNCDHPHINKEGWSEEEIQKLKTIAEDHNFVDWQAIAQELGTNRTAFQCLQMFQRNNKDFKRSEFTKEEDETLTHFVQRMRVGEHIPYCKISYFMEGRDGLQLLHRWTKSLDPSLRKGPWSKEEDEMLLKAVAKHGEKDWYKIRLEVPGRSDVQCRERYLKGLHKDVKKGKWSEEERNKLVELTEKYGVGHWAQVCKELPHRTGSQCLSKWKQMNGYFKRRRERLKQNRPPKPRKRSKAIKPKKIEDEVSSCSTDNSSSESSVSISSSSSSSSSESEDEAMDLMENSGEAEISNLLQSIPDLDLWIPKRRNPGLHGKTLLVYSSPNITPTKTKKKIKGKTFQFNTILKGIAYPPSSDTVTETVDDFLKEAEQNGCEILQIREEDIVKILMRNTKESESKQIQRLKQKLSRSSPDSDTDQHEGSSKSLSQLAVSRLYKASVDRKLLCAVTRWVGNVLLPLSTSTGRHFKRQTLADEINKKLSCVTITSTPIFTLLIQFFQIDAEGCLQMIRLQKADESETVKNTTTKSAHKTAVSDSMSPKSILVRSFNDQNPNPVIPQAAKTKPSASSKQVSSLPKVPKVKTFVPAPKRKTVSELLQEKRMQKSKANKAAQRTAILSRNILVSPQIVIQQPSNATVQPRTIVLPMTPTLQNGSWPTVPFSPVPARQVATINNGSANPMSPVRAGPSSGLVSDTAGSVPVAQMACHQENVQSKSPGVPPVPQPLSGQVTLLPSSLPFTILVTPQGLISIPTQALQCPNLIQQLGSQSPKIVSTPLNTAAPGTSVTPFSNSSASYAPFNSLFVTGQTSPITTSSTTQINSAISSTAVNCSQVSGTNLPGESSRKSSEIVTAVTSDMSQHGTVASLVRSIPDVANSPLTNIAPPEVSKMPSVVLPTITNSTKLEDMATTSSVDSSLLGTGPCLPMPTPSEGLTILSQTVPATTSYVNENAEKIALTESQPPMTGSSLTPSSAPKAVCHVFPTSTSSLTQIDKPTFSQIVNWQKEDSSQLPELSPSKTSIIPSSSLRQEDTLVASVADACLPKVTLPQGLPNKGSQLKLTPQKYPIVKITKLLQTNHPKEDMANVTKDPQRSSVLNRCNQTPTSERKSLDLKLISLAEETSVKEWLQVKQGVEVPNKNGAIPYLPPSICTLKTFSRLLLEKKTLEENAFKLLPVSDVTEVSSQQMQTTLSDMVEENLKDNMAFKLLKKRFLSEFTIPGLLAVLPPTPISTKQEDSDEDIEDLMNNETNTTGATDKQNDVDDAADSVGNISDGASPTVAEQTEVMLQCSSENPNSVDTMDGIAIQSSIYCQPVT